MSDSLEYLSPYTLRLYLSPSSPERDCSDGLRAGVIRLDLPINPTLTRSDWEIRFFTVATWPQVLLKLLLCNRATY